jgi:hypothetical protein
MAMINEATQSQRLNTHAASTTALGQSVSKGDEDYLVAGRFDALGNIIKPYADKLGELFDRGGTATGKVLGAGGGLGRAREKMKELQRQQSAAQTPAPATPTQPLSPGAPAIGDVPTAQDAAGLGVPGAAPMTPQRVVPVEAIDANLANQSNRLRPPSISGDEVLQDLLEPRRTALLSDGLTDFTAVGARGDVKIPDEGNIHALIESTSKQYRRSGEVTDATRGVVEQEASEELAAALGMEPDALVNAIFNYKDTGGVPYVKDANLSETILATRNLFYSEMAKLDALADKASGSAASAEDLLNFRQQLDFASQLQLNMKGIQTEVGRSLGVYRYPIDPNAGARRELDMTTILQQFGGPGDIADLVTAYRQLPTGAPRAQFIQRAKPMQRFTNALYEWWINMLLTSGVTHVKNFAGAALTTFGEIPVGIMAATIGTVRRGMGGTGGVTYGDVYAEMFGQVMSMQEAFAGAAHAARTGEQVITGSKLSGALGAQAGRRAPAISAEAFGVSGNWGKAIDVLGTTVTLGRASTRALEFEDTFWKVAAQRGSLWKQASREARGRGLTGVERENFLAGFMFNPPAAAIEEADNLARKVTLQETLQNIPGRSFQDIARWGAMRWFVPFIKTPYNALRFAFEHSPLGPVTKTHREAIASGDRVRMDTARARVALGWGAALAVGGYAYSGQITGGGPSDPGLRAALYRQGWRPYSVKIGGEYFSYHGAEPYSTIIGVMADMVEIAQAGQSDQETIAEIGTAVMFALAKNLTNKTFMQGFNNLIGAMADPDRHADSILKNFVRSGVPRVVANWNKAQDAQMRRGGANVPLPPEMQRLGLNELQKYPEITERFEGGQALAFVADMRDQIVAQIPGFSSTMPSRYDLWGKPVMYADTMGSKYMSPIYRSVHKPNEIDKELYRLKFRDTQHPDTWQGVPLKDAELEFFHKRAGKYSLQKVTKLMGGNKYKRSRAIAIATNQKIDEPRNEELRYDIRKEIKEAREKAFRDLKKDPKLGPSVRAMMRQNKRITKAVTRKRKRDENAAKREMQQGYSQ